MAVAMKRTGKRRSWIAALAIFVLFAHAMVASFVDGAMAQPQLVDPFGNPICSAHEADRSSDPAGPTGDHTHLPDCCLAGCSLAGGHALAVADQPFRIVRLAVPSRAVAPAYRIAVVAFERSPLNPRAPPASA
jgi:hypothetical protein